MINNYKELISQMSLTEKLAQMTQLWGESPDGTPLMGIEHGFHKNKDLSTHAGSILGYYGAENIIKAQKAHLEERNNKIPLMFMTDVIHGFRTIFPSVIGLAATWSPSLIEETAAVAAKEASVSGIHVTFSPMADLVRDARWGRVVESAGEDPYLNSLYSAAFVRGYQGDHMGEPYRIASCVKHLAGYGAAESGKDYNSVEISDYQLYNNYFPSFRAALYNGCKMVMPGFHTLNGIPCTVHDTLLRKILREEWGFDGTIITDCTAVYELTAHGVCIDQADAAMCSIHAGNDIEMVSTTFYEHGEELFKNNKITLQEIDTAVEHILRLKDELGLFENPYKDASIDKEKEFHLCEEHLALAREVSAKSLVLLKNEGNALPLSPNETIALIGPYANSKKHLDIWHCNGKESECTSIFEALCDTAQVKYAPGCELIDLGAPDSGPFTDTNALREAVKLAASCDKVILALGEHPNMSGEAGSRAFLSLPENQMNLLRRITALGKPVVVVLFSGRPLALEEVSASCNALLQAWFPGTEGGNAIADILTGARKPSGRLTISFPRSVGQLPLYYNHLPTGRPQSESSDSNRFASGYIDSSNAPLYPFGYGLTYTTFEYSNVTLSKTVITPDETLQAEVHLKNTGKETGTETVQLYLRDWAGTYSRPVRMLKDFRQITLLPEEETDVVFTISREQLEYYIPSRGTVLEPGKFSVFIGPDSRTTNQQSFILECK